MTLCILLLRMSLAYSLAYYTFSGGSEEKQRLMDTYLPFDAFFLWGICCIGPL